MKTVLFYTKETCSLCDEAAALLKMFQNDYAFKIEIRDIYTNDNWLEEFQLLIPVVEVDGHQLNCEEIGFDALNDFLNKHISC